MTNQRTTTKVISRSVSLTGYLTLKKNLNCIFILRRMFFKDASSANHLFSHRLNTNMLEKPAQVFENKNKTENRHLRQLVHTNNKTKGTLVHEHR